ncbi:ATP-binding cassette domain-containing protein [Clostridium sp. SHJSY1]|uniref:ATP-binding cassette domain-containing protein n=1 Tax=Clostridium sp. SHJSY1 TaxID=2942483 RepID=UPI0028761433|nr:ATP-binding cassette domain-containing protein [Clostridium sp. SHJSY1]MDS0527087.1 ATP-binding cassette domain-containing protein [Clostridium sp. SHJSY1]
MDIIKIEKLVKQYDESKKALTNITFEVKEGECFGLLGPNGAGKSTLINILTTLIRETSGECYINGIKITEKPLLARMQFGLVSQNLMVDDKLTAWQNLYLTARYYHIDKNEIPSRIDQALQIVNLSEAKDKLVETFSGGMKRRLDISAALIHNPKVLFLDEPTVGLDIQTRREIWRYIKQLQKEKKTSIFLTTHYMEEADKLCDRIAILDHGCIKALDTPKNLKKNLEGELIILKSKKNSKKLKEVFEKKEYVNKCKIQEDQVILQVQNCEKVLLEILQSIKEEETEIDLLSTKQPTLDDVYLDITGNSLESKNQGYVMRNHMHGRR